MAKYSIVNYEDAYDKPLEKVTALIVGRSGFGKTTWLGSVAAVDGYWPMLIISFDRSTRSLVNKNFLDLIGWQGDPKDYPLSIVPLEDDFDIVNEVFKDLKAGRINWRGIPYKSVGLDNLSESQLRITSKLLKSDSPAKDRMRNDVPGWFDYRVVKNVTYQYMDSFVYRLPGIHVFATADIYEDKDDDGNLTEIGVNLSTALKDILPRQFDIIGQLRMRGTARYIITQKTPAFPVLRDKTSTLPAEVAPLWSTMYSHMAGKIEKEAVAASTPIQGVKRLTK